MSNVIAVCCGIVPSYLANRSWVWAKTGRSSLVREVVPFWMLSLAGLVASTVAVAWVASSTRGWSTSLRAIALPGGQPQCVRRALDRAVRTARPCAVRSVAEGAPLLAQHLVHDEDREQSCSDRGYDETGPSRHIEASTDRTASSR